MSPCIPLVAILVLRPRPKRPKTPSFCSITHTASGQVIFSVQVCLVVLMTLIELEIESEITEHTKPIAAHLTSFFGRLSGSGIIEFSLLKVQNQGQCPMKVAVAVAIAPQNKVCGPDLMTFQLRIAIPCLPSTWRIVFNVSTGVRRIQKRAAIVEALSVLTDMLSLRVLSCESRYSKTSLFEKVSPNQDSGPCSKATAYPR